VKEPENPMPDSTTERVVLVTGPSGAGRSTAINALEDLGFEAIDNLPLSLLPRLLEGPGPEKPLALGIDVRNRDFSTMRLIEEIDRIGAREATRLQVIYLDCSAEILLRRFSETRRRHPLAQTQSPEDGIAREFDLLGPIKARADLLIDTTEMSPHDLREELARWFAPGGTAPLSVTIHSFSYKRGLPRGLDTVFDCRFLRNPHWDATLRSSTGTDPAVAAYIAQDPRFEEFHDRVTGLIAMLLPAFKESGKAYLAIGFGCTGGRHRSVAMTESVAKALEDRGWQVSIRHRELERQAAPLPSPATEPATEEDDQR
jgi:UPF0042 nucleotide-binding protein